MMTSRSSWEIPASDCILDIETIPIGWNQVPADHVPMDLVAGELAQVLAKDPPTHAGLDARWRWLWREVAAAYQRASRTASRASLDPKRAYVLCAGLAFGEEPPTVVWGPTEHATLGMLLDLLEQRRPRRIVAWRGRDFDFPFLWERAVGWGLPELARWFRLVRYGEARELGLPPPLAVLVDPRRLWATTRESSDSGAAIRRFLGIELPNPIHGGQVLQCMRDGRPEIVREHLIADVLELQQVWKRLAPSLGIAGNADQ